MASSALAAPRAVSFGHFKKWQNTDSLYPKQQRRTKLSMHHTATAVPCHHRSSFHQSGARELTGDEGDEEEEAYETMGIIVTIVSFSACRLS